MGGPTTTGRSNGRAGDLFLLTLRAIGSRGLGGPLDRLGGHLEADQNFHRFATVIEGGLLAH
jgi:hypothetical protein